MPGQEAWRYAPLVPSFAEWVVERWRALGRFADGSRAVPALFLLSLLVYGAVSLAVPLEAGRDLPRYLLAYIELFQAHVVYPQAILTRTRARPSSRAGCSRSEARSLPRRPPRSSTRSRWSRGSRPLGELVPRLPSPRRSHCSSGRVMSFSSTSSRATCCSRLPSRCSRSSSR